ncbi:MAG: putative DNA binding domain-containing protein [Gammaproteobacteria bacterium]|nr:putative DNA binding domain-containing protein [Gammaproteobacteria bacterium]
MLDSQTDLLKKIRLREDSYLEVKEVRFAGKRISDPHRDSIADTITAFANTRGGVLVLGVDDKTFDIVGIPVERIELVTNFIHEICTDKIEPSLETVLIEHLLLPSCTGEESVVVKVDVSQSLFVHRSPGGYMQRVGNAKRSMSPDYLARMFQQRSQSRLIRFDEMPVHSALLTELDQPMVERFRTGGARDDFETLARKMGMIGRRGEDGRHPTVAGVLMATSEPQQWLAHAYIQAVAYRGKSPADFKESGLYQIDAQDITGPLDSQIKDACLFVIKNQKVRASKKIARVETPQYDMAAVFEAIVNAVAHRDYSMHGTRIRLHMFSDRIEFYSPGSLPNAMTVDDLAYRQAGRNETLNSLLAKCPAPAGISGLDTQRSFLMDRRGIGVPTILEKSEQHSGRQPVYEVLGDAELRLTIYAAEPDDD